MVWPCEKKEVDTPVRRCERITIPKGKRCKGRPNKSLDEVIREDLKVIGLTEDMTQDRRLWWHRIRILDQKELAT